MKKALPLDEWNKAIEGIPEDVDGSRFPPILCEGKTSKAVIEEIEEILGDFMWDVWDEAGILKSMIDENRVGYATIQYEGKPCSCCGNYSGTVRYFDRNARQLHETEFSD